ncbi:MAG: GlsB/YeaQ/YmgE family stress response membrane protein [Patescibacteria group bacterium]
MSWLITLIIGAIMGLLFRWAMGKRIGTWHSIISGIVGAITGYWFFVDVLGFGIAKTSIGFFSGAGLIWEIIGSIIVLAIMSAMEYEEMETREKHAYGPSVAHEYKEEKWERRKDDDKHYK